MKMPKLITLNIRTKVDINEIDARIFLIQILKTYYSSASFIEIDEYRIFTDIAAKAKLKDIKALFKIITKSTNYSDVKELFYLIEGWKGISFKTEELNKEIIDFIKTNFLVLK